MNTGLLSRSNLIEPAGVDAANTGGATLTAGGVSHSKGSYSQIIASTSYEWAGFHLIISPMTNLGRGFIIDIAIGAAGSEQIILPDFVVRFYGTLATHTYIPLVVPAGVRLSARCQSTGGGGNQVDVILYGAPPHPLWPGGYHRATNYGADTSTTQGTAISPSSTADTKGGYAVLSSSTANLIRAATLCLTRVGDTVGSLAYLVDTAIGAASSEQIVIPDLATCAHVYTSMQTMSMGPFGLNIPASTRLTMRCQSNVSSGPDLYGSIIGYD